MPYGDLLGYLRKSRGLDDVYYNDPDVKPETNLMSQQLMKFAWQVADGMSYLSSRSVRLHTSFFCPLLSLLSILSRLSPWGALRVSGKQNSLFPLEANFDTKVIS